VRYFGVDTPERDEPCYREAVDRNQLLLGSHVYLLPDSRERDDGGRLLRYVFLPDGRSLDATLVAEGFGMAWREAEAAGRGCLWSDD
jgi:endonuclease YncB( thermonuclease family)